MAIAPSLATELTDRLTLAEDVAVGIALKIDDGSMTRGRNPVILKTLELLGIEYHPTDAPGGSAVLMFSHGGALRLDVECLECELADLGPDDLGTADAGEGAESSGLDA